MIMQTFFNLSEEKRKIILDVALDEFALHDFENVSVSRIVEKAGIAKGSFYQYFDEKKDLYLYLIDLSIESRIKYVSIKLQDYENEDFFKYLYHFMEFLSIYEAENPKHGQIICRALSERSAIQNEINTKIRCTLLKYFSDLVQHGVKQGTVREDINTETIVYLIHIVVYNFINFLTYKFNLDINQLMQRDYSCINFNMHKNEILDIINLIKNGIAKTDQY